MLPAHEPGDGRRSAVWQRPEHDLLRACCVRRQSASELRAILQPRLEPGIDWPYFCRWAERHGVLPRCAAALEAVEWFAVPEGTRRRLRQSHRAIVQRNLFLTSELVRLLRRLSGAGLTVLPFKGPVLAIAADGGLTLRQFEDLDLLLPRAQVQDAQALLGREGFQLTSPLIARGGVDAYLRAEEYHLGLFKPAERLLVELHWRLAPAYLAFPLEWEELQQRAAPVRLAGETVFAPSAEDTLLILAMHGAKHRWPSLSMVADVAELIRQQSALDWPRLMGAATRLGCVRAVGLALHLARDLMEVELPEAVGRPLEPSACLAALAREVYERFFLEQDDPFSNLEVHRFYLRCRERFRDRLPYYRKMAPLAFTPSAADRAWVRLPAALAFGYYLLKPVRLAGKYLRRAVRRGRSVSP